MSKTAATIREKDAELERLRADFRLATNAVSALTAQLTALQADAQRKDEALKDARHFILHVKDVTESRSSRQTFAAIDSEVRKIDAVLSVGQQEKIPPP